MQWSPKKEGTGGAVLGGVARGLVPRQFRMRKEDAGKQYLETSVSAFQTIGVPLTLTLSLRKGNRKGLFLGRSAGSCARHIGMLGAK